MPRIVYLEPVRGASFRSQLRSDTLWSALCWSIRDLFGKDKLEQFIEAYKNNEGPLHLSSTFPWVDTLEGRQHYLPNPLRQPPPPEAATVKGTTALKHALRLRKIVQKRDAWINWEELERGLVEHEQTTSPRLRPHLQPAPMTHNLVDRRRLGTLTENGNGQLYHTLENGYRWNNKDVGVKTGATGLYFFVHGTDALKEIFSVDKVDDCLRSLFRYVSVNGLGGDRTIGKGHFRVRLADHDAHEKQESGSPLPRITNANARVSLSLYHPAETGEDLRALVPDGDPLLQYKLEDRQGRSVEDSQDQLAGKLYFQEGSVFPAATLTTAFPGHLVPMRQHRLGHTIYRYGYAFLLDLKIPTL